MRKEVAIMAELLIKTQGQAMFSFGECSKLIGCGPNHLARYFHEAGILVKKQGPAKLISAYNLAEYMCINRVSPID